MTEASYPKIKKKVVVIGYQAPKGRRLNSGFNQIGVRDMHYCWSHDFWFNTEEQDKLLHEGKPCFYTDCYGEGNSNFYREGYMLHRNKHYGKSLKSCIRMIKNTRNLPVGTIVEIGHPYYGTGQKSKKSFSFSYKFKITKENKFDPQYEVSRPSFSKNFNTDQKANELTDLLRANGFLVSVNNKNPNFISGMISSAAAAVGKSVETTDEEGEIATAYGHGLRIGYSSNDSTYRGYSYGVKSVLFDRWDEFDKWSRCLEISKEKTNEEILKILLDVKNEVRQEEVNEY